MLQKKRLEWIFGFPFLSFIESEEKVKFGLDSLAHNIKQDVYMFKSMLTYDPENDNSLLHLLWRYHGRMDVYTINCLEHLGNFLVADDSICEFFSNLPGLSYQYARYTDWIRPYLEKQMVSTGNNSVNKE